MQSTSSDFASFVGLPERAQPQLSLPTFSEGNVLLPRPDFTILNAPSASRKWVTVKPVVPTLDEKLFDATAKAKIWTSKVAMHLDPAARKRFFAQLDRLHDREEWAGEDLPVNLESYKGLIRAVVKFGIHNGPSLALMPNGHLLAMWTEGADRLSVEFLSDGRARWVLSRSRDGYKERAAGETSLERLRAVLAPYNADGWFIGS